MNQSLEKADTLINLRNQEISELNSRLAAKDEIIAEADEQIENLESDLASAKEAIELMNSKTEQLLRSPAPIDTDFLEPADLLNQLKARRKKSKADLGDMDAVVELLSQLWSGETVP